MYQPEGLDKYSGNQLLISANRISFIGKKDSILLQANQSISLSSNTSVNIDTKRFIIEAERIELGTHAKEPLILGNEHNALMTKIINALMDVSDALSKSVNGPLNTPDLGLNIAGARLKRKLTIIKSDLSKLLSKISFTK